MPFHVVPNTRLSLSQLASLHHAGQPVLKTPHVGNQYPNNLAVASIGIPLLLVDQTIGEKDRNFHPHTIICDGTKEQIADSTRLTSHARIARQPTRHSDRFVPGEELAAAHVRALKDAIPQAQIMTTRERAARHASLYIKVLRVLTMNAPRAWTRYVSSDGRITNRTLTCVDQLEHEGIHGADEHEGAGWIIPNAWNILIDGIFAASTHKTSEMYSLSGPDMIVYIGKYQETFHAEYDLVRNALAELHLPEQFTCNIIPVADMRFAVAGRYRQTLDDLMEAYMAWHDFRRNSGQKLAHLTGQEKQARIAEMTRDRSQLQRRLQEACVRCPYIFYDIAQANFLSQYDLLAGESLYVHPWGIESSLQDVTEAMRVFERLYSTA